MGVPSIGRGRNRPKTVGGLTVQPSTALAPAASLAPRTTPTEVVQATEARLYAKQQAAKAVEVFVAVLGGREGLINELLISPEITPRIQSVLTLVLDPRFADYPLAYLCDKAGLVPGEVFAAFRDAKVALANIEAMRRVANALPDIVDQFLRDAVDREQSCAVCHGTGTVTVQEGSRRTAPKAPRHAPCKDCYGRGTILVPANREAQKTVFEIIGLLRKSGLSVNQFTQLNQQTTLDLQVDASDGSAGLAQLQQAVSGILFGQPLALPVPQGEESLAPERAPEPSF